MPVRVLVPLIFAAVVALELHLWLVGYGGDTSTAALASLGYVLFPIYGLLLIALLLIVESAVRAWTQRRFANRFVKPS